MKKTAVYIEPMALDRSSPLVLESTKGVTIQVEMKYQIIKHTFIHFGRFHLLFASEVPKHCSKQQCYERSKVKPNSSV